VLTTVIVLSITLRVISYSDYPLSSIQPNKHSVSEAGNNNNTTKQQHNKTTTQKQHNINKTTHQQNNTTTTTTTTTQGVCHAYLDKQ
jgi:hypothetical protein